MNVEQVTVLLAGYALAGVRGAVVAGALTTLIRAIVAVVEKEKVRREDLHPGAPKSWEHEG